MGLFNPVDRHGGVALTKSKQKVRRWLCQRGVGVKVSFCCHNECETIYQRFIPRIHCAAKVRLAACPEAALAEPAAHFGRAIYSRLGSNGRVGHMNTIRAAYNAFCEERFPLPTGKAISDLETRIGVELPADYRQYLVEFNGGFFSEPEITPPLEECPADRLISMGGLGATDPAEELASEAALGMFDDNYPAQVLPIGSTLMGNLILLITHPEGRGCIVLKKAFSDDSFVLAEGIEEFFGLLREPPS